MIVTHLRHLREQLKAINPEMGVATPIRGRTYQAGLIAFQTRAALDDKFITHAASDFLTHGLAGRGRLRLRGTKAALEPGSLCHSRRARPTTSWPKEMRRWCCSMP